MMDFVLATSILLVSILYVANADVPPDAECYFPMDIGTGRAAMQRWHYDPNSGHCLMFLYGGAGGNGNNFKTEMQCRDMCISIKPTDPGPVDAECSLPMDIGTGRAAMQRWHYDSTSGQCLMFLYGGAGGNGNNFKTEKQCRHMCISIRPTNPGPVDAECSLPMDIGTGRAAMQRWHYDSTSGQCLMFLYGGAGGNGNNFKTEKQCRHTCICTRPKDPGPCRAGFKKYHFNRSTNKCEIFLYGGCLGNANLFDTESECQQTCICSKEVQVGNCRANIKSYHYNDKTMKCEEFFYSGCDGNANRFSSLSECSGQCICGSKPETGPCRAAMAMKYYHKESGTCKTFTYGGCFGNGNRFKTEQDCLNTCKI